MKKNVKTAELVKIAAAYDRKSISEWKTECRLREEGESKLADIFERSSNENGAVVKALASIIEATCGASFDDVFNAIEDEKQAMTDDEAHELILSL